MTTTPGIADLLAALEDMNVAWVIGVGAVLSLAAVFYKRFRK